MKPDADTMNPQTAKAAQRFRESIDQWFSARIRECYQCRDCEASVSPWDDVCPTCGGGSPAKISTSAGVVLVAAFIFLIAIAVIGAWLF